MFFFDGEQPRNRRGAPPIGTTLYVVREHLYYADGRVGPLLEYGVYAGRLRGFIEGGYVQMELLLEKAGANNLAFPKLNALGKTVFYTAREAALLAKEMTEDYERRWAWTAQWGDVPLRRPWANLLTEVHS